MSDIDTSENKSVTGIQPMGSVDILSKEERSRRTWNIIKGVFLLLVGFVVSTPIYIIVIYAMSGFDTPERLTSDDELNARIFMLGFPVIVGGFFLWAAFKIMTNKVTVSEVEKPTIIALHDDMHPNHEQAKRKQFNYFLLVISGVLLIPSYFFGAFIQNLLVVRNLNLGLSFFLFFLIFFVIRFVKFKKSNNIIS